MNLVRIYNSLFLYFGVTDNFLTHFSELGTFRKLGFRLYFISCVFGGNLGLIKLEL